MFEKWGRGSYPYVRGKLPRITQACGNKRFTDSDGSKVKRGPTRRNKAADGPLRGPERLFHEPESALSEGLRAKRARGSRPREPSSSSEDGQASLIFFNSRRTLYGRLARCCCRWLWLGALQTDGTTVAR